MLKRRYISHLFRAYHDDAELTKAPFTPEQVARLEAGLIPDPPL